jgi:hypothetical protein
MMHGHAKRLSVYQNGPSERNGRQMLVILESTNACATCYIYGVVSDDLSYRAVRIRVREDISLSEDSQTPPPDCMS